MAAADDRLVSVVGINAQTPPGKNAGENVAGTGDALPVFSADANRKINCGHLNKFLSICEMI
jgi:hypothetical protein